MRKQIAAANWKMNLSYSEAETLLDALVAQAPPMQGDRLALIAVPFPYLLLAKQKLAATQAVWVTAQNCAATNNGAYTGEVSAAMLQSMQIEYVLIGHSERREYYHETNAVLTEKINRALESGIKPVFCCGEPLAIREAGTENQFVETQLQESLFHLSAEQITGFIIAYEPIWAIGTGKTASSDQAQDMHRHIRSVLAARYGQSVADSISILYGGSVKAANAVEIFGKPDVDGGLVGGASLNATEFSSIMGSLK
jgi:triosephosphate isomerase